MFIQNILTYIIKYRLTCLIVFSIVYVLEMKMETNNYLKPAN